MIVVPREIIMVHLHHVAKYEEHTPGITDAEALQRNTTGYELVIDGVVARSSTLSYDADTESEMFEFLAGIEHAFQYYFSVLDFPTHTVQHKVVRATK